ETEFPAGDYPTEYVAVELSDDMPLIVSKSADAWARSPHAVPIILRGTEARRDSQDVLALGTLQGAREARRSIAAPGPAGLGLAPATPATPAAPVKARRVVPASHNGRFRYGGRVRSTNWGKLLTLIVSLLVVALVGGSAYAYVYLPEGVVSVTPLNQVREGIP